MIPSFTTNLLSLGELYSTSNNFRTPAFQRPYSWTTKEAGQLLEDIRQAAETGHSNSSSTTADYFLGTIVLLRANLPAKVKNINGAPHGGAHASFYDIIDGQQRLVTLTILLAVLRDLDRSDENLSLSHIQSHIQLVDDKDDGPHDRLVLDGQDGATLSALVQVQDESDLILKETPHAAGSQRILDVIEHFHNELHDVEPSGRCAIADYLLARCAFVIIETSHIDRAYQMFTVLNHRGKPLARADIIKARLIGTLPLEDHDRFAQQWTDLQESFGDKYDTLFSHIRTIHGYNRDRIVSELLEITASAGGARPFLDKIVLPLADAFKRIVQPELSAHPKSIEAYSDLNYLNWLRAKDWMPVAMLWLSRHPDDPEQIKQFLHALDRLAFGLLLLGKGTVKRKNRYRALLREIQNNEPVLSNNGALALDKDDQRNILYNVSHDLHGRSQHACKLALLRLNDDIAGEPQNFQPNDFTVEHILPLKLSGSSRWREWYPVADGRAYCTQCLGNMTLISPGDNEKAGNKDFAEKVEIYFKENEPSGIQLTDMLHGKAHWREENVMARDAELLERLKALWQLAGPTGRKGARLRTEIPKQTQQSPSKGFASRQAS